MEQRRRSVEEVIGISAKPRLERSSGFEDPPLMNMMRGLFGMTGSSTDILMKSSKASKRKVPRKANVTMLMSTN